MSRSRTETRLLVSDPRIKPTGSAGSNQGPATTDIKNAHVRDRSGLEALRGPATKDIDSPSLRGRRRLNRRVHLILSQETFHSRQCVGIQWESLWEWSGNLGILAEQMERLMAEVVPKLS